MIPKIIHYCLFSGDKKPEKIAQCIESWTQVMPDYQIKCWDANSFDFDSVPFVKDAYARKRWAYVADYVRLYAIYTEGGIYLDSDVMVFKPFDDLLNDKMFIGLESCSYLYPQAAIFGAEKGNPILGDMLHCYYDKLTEPLTDDTLLRICKFDSAGREIFNDAGELQVAIAPVVFNYYFKKYGFKQEDTKQELEHVTVYPLPVFIDDASRVDETTYAIHLVCGSWLNPLYLDKKNIKGKLYRFCKRYRLFKTYAFIISVKKRLYKFIGKKI